MYYADIKRVDVANGLGVRVSLFVSGCHHHCKNCFNQEAWDFHYGQPFTQKTMELLLEYLEGEHIAGLSLLGGEPLEPVNQEGLLPVIREFKKRFPNKNIWCYTGYNFETDILQDFYRKSEITKELIHAIDVIVDGKFEEEKKDISLRFRGSSNQRIIDVPKTLHEGKIILLNLE